MIDEPPSDEHEQAEAAELARALERGHAPPSAIDDAVDAADVVRMLKAPALSADRVDAVVRDGEQRVAAARRRARARIAVFGSAATALALAAAALLIVRAPQSEPSVAKAPSAPGPAAEAPIQPAPAAAGAAPSGPARALRDAQVAWLEAPTQEAHVALERALGAYRGEQLALLAARYEP